VSKPHKYAAFVAYLLPVVGWLIAFLFYRDDEFTMFHTKQAIALALLVLAAPVIYLVVSWLVLWVPLAGALIAAASFTLVMLVAFAALVLWIVGLVYALQGKQQALPIVGRWVGQSAG
jgi:uncharacterized membrane protein